MTIPASPRASKSTNVRARYATVVRALQALARLSPGAAAQTAAALFFVRPPRRRPTPEEHATLTRGTQREIHTLAGRAVAWTFTTDDRPAVLLVHGWAGSGSQLHALVDPLLAAGLAPIVVDLPSHGAAPGLRTTIPAWADALVGVARTLTGTASIHAVIAHSLGAAAAALALERGLTARRVVLLAPVADPSDYFRGFVGAATRDPDALAAAERTVERRLGITFADLSVPTIATRQRAALLVIHDVGDRETPVHGGAAIARAWPGAELVTTVGLSHRRILADPGVIERAVAFTAMDVEVPGLCLTPGCHRPVDRERPEDEGRCAGCALEHELAHPHLRWVRAKAA